MDEQTFLRLLADHEGRLYRIALAITGQDADAWDALQDAVEAAVRSRHELRGGARAFPSWIRQIVVTRSLNLMRSRRRVVPVDPSSAPEPVSLPPPQDSVVAREVWRVVERLQEDQRQVVALRFLADLSLDEIASRLSLPLSTVKSRLYRALRQLRDTLIASGERRASP